MIVIQILQPVYFLHMNMELYRQHNWQYLNLRIHNLRIHNGRSTEPWGTPYSMLFRLLKLLLILIL